MFNYKQNSRQNFQAILKKKKKKKKELNILINFKHYLHDWTREVSPQVQSSVGYTKDTANNHVR